MITLHLKVLNNTLYQLNSSAKSLFGHNIFFYMKELITSLNASYTLYLNFAQIIKLLFSEFMVIKKLILFLLRLKLILQQI